RPPRHDATATARGDVLAVRTPLQRRDHRGTPQTLLPWGATCGAANGEQARPLKGLPRVNRRYGWQSLVSSRLLPTDPQDLLCVSMSPLLRFGTNRAAPADLATIPAV